MTYTFGYKSHSQQIYTYDNASHIKRSSYDMATLIFLENEINQTHIHHMIIPKIKYQQRKKKDVPIIVRGFSLISNDVILPALFSLGNLSIILKFTHSQVFYLFSCPIL